MRPYYEQSGVTIYHGDCREILPLVDAGSVDLLVTDPPYGQNYSRHDSRGLLVLDGDDDAEGAQALCRTALTLAVHTLKPRRHVYVFGPFNLAGLPLRSVVELIWDKQSHTGGDLNVPWATAHERFQFAVYAGGRYDEARNTGGLSARLRRGSVVRVLRNCDGAVRQHPTEKPVRLIRELIESSSRMDEVVLDPFMGGGSTLIAARLEGRHAIGIEINERYCELAATRLRAGERTLFADVTNGLDAFFDRAATGDQ